MSSKKEHGIYNIGTGSSTLFMKLVGFLNASLHTNIKPTFIPTPIRNYVKHTKADTTLAKTELGYDARWTIGDGIKKITALDQDERLEIELAQKLNELPSN
jgi:nucleoside-diphosphate-sugar epimerase